LELEIEFKLELEFKVKPKLKLEFKLKSELGIKFKLIFKVWHLAFLFYLDIYILELLLEVLTA
jgi:hypothetical protein